MAQLGISVMMHHLSGGSPNDPEKYYGKTIHSALLDQENEKLKITFDDGLTIAIWDDGQS